MPDIPPIVISKTTLECVGFSADKATAVWNAWTDHPQATDKGNKSFLYFMTVWPYGSHCPFLEHDDEKWRQAMTAFGLSTDVQDKIMHPAFRELRLTRSCTHWCRDTVEIRFKALRYTQKPREHSRRAPAPSIFDKSESLTHIAARGISDHTILFKDIDEARADGFLDTQGCVQHISRILHSSPSDFSSDRVYFHPELATVQCYAGYAKQRGTDETNIMIVCIAIPNAVLQGLLLTDCGLQRLYWPSEAWQEFVDCNRTRQTVPLELCRYQLATLLIGSTAKYRLTCHRGVTEDTVLVMDGRPAVRYVFDGSDDGQDFLEKSIAQRPYIYHFTNGDWNTWLAEFEPRESGVQSAV
ncbi:uncharacterized protein F5Z01DRAFT_530129 [Emericellopsis atlantica]|uniref:Uncharacterized protein n=1 Tax=Emericellopsis atlantica TaxID=2614577 RepID=A0A9P8CR97_9HYPO|nr:uncharacterized protein F5Z01DRAFT_530129 [Emericellopsis atlantica]KAG9255960.1 hypothetical protein F5Z01DRAFT_530129 [Emericellopsis atlantica]